MRGVDLRGKITITKVPVIAGASGCGIGKAHSGPEANAIRCAKGRFWSGKHIYAKGVVAYIRLQRDLRSARCAPKHGETARPLAPCDAATTHRPVEGTAKGIAHIVGRKAFLAGIDTIGKGVLMSPRRILQVVFQIDTKAVWLGTLDGHPNRGNLIYALYPIPQDMLPAARSVIWVA